VNGFGGLDKGGGSGPQIVDAQWNKETLPKWKEIDGKPMKGIVREHAIHGNEVARKSPV
jgi:hypothetical protein